MGLKEAILFTVLSIVRCEEYTCEQKDTTTLWAACPVCRNNGSELVCGSDNFTYFNLCLVDCVNGIKKTKGEPSIRIAYRSICEHEQVISSYECGSNIGGTDDCSECKTSVLAPVCGSDKETYDNLCFFYCTKRNRKDKNMQISHDSACDPAYGNRTHEYVCSRKQETKKYPLFYNTKACGRAFRVPYLCDECKSFTEWNPLCASDSNTYGNDCYFQCAITRSREQGKIGPRKLRAGSCDPSWEKYFLFFKEVADQYTGLDRKCIIGDLTSIRVSKSTIERTDSTDCNEHCSPSFEPICGSDGLTYMSDCLLQCVKQHGRAEGVFQFHNGSCESNLDIYMDYFWYVSKTLSGRYKPENSKVFETAKQKWYCPACQGAEIDPVCATNLKNYDNMCKLDCASQEVYVPWIKIEKVANGRCESYEWLGWSSDPHQTFLNASNLQDTLIDLTPSKLLKKYQPALITVAT